MGAVGAWAMVAVAAAAGAGALFGTRGAQAWQRRSSAAAALAPSRRERVALLLSKGCEPLRPAARKLLGYAAIRKVADAAMMLLEERGASSTPEAILSLALAAAAACGLAAGLLTGSPIGALAVACVALIGGAAFVRNAAEKRVVAMREQIPDALRCMGTCFRSGLSLPQTLRQTAKECGGALGCLFQTAVRRLEMGATPTEALSVMRSDAEVPELSFVAVALDVQHQSGGSIAPVLETARESVMSELDLMRSLRVQTAQAKLSASIVTVMPFLLVALFSLMSPDFLQPFFGSVAGMALLALALAMQFAGVLAVRRMLHVEAG